MASIGNINIEGKVFLAPMAGVTNSAFRTICRENGAALTYTEMVSAKALCYKDKKTAELLYIDDNEHPIATQIFGHEPEIMAEGACLALEMCKADILDINMGCPVGKLAKNNDGAALMRDIDLASEIISAVVKAVDVPVTVKFRKGWDSSMVNAVEFAKMCENSGAAAVAVHGRTRVQMYSGKADWDIIKEVKNTLSIPVIANGDILSGGDAVKILEHTGADFCMIGRGSFGDPWLFSRAKAAINGEIEPNLPSLAERMDTAYRQVMMTAEQKGERLACVEARGSLSWYLHGVAHSAPYKNELVRVSSLEELKDVIKAIKRDLR